jgi:uncharacterized protein (TIGR03067 family)
LPNEALFVFLPATAILFRKRRKGGPSMKPVKAILAGLALLLVVSQAPAEYRTVLVQVKRDKDRKVAVAIYSDVKEEQKSAVCVNEAVKVLRSMRGWGSSVGVYVTSDGRMARADLKKLLGAVTDNIHLDLVYFGDRVPRVVGDHFLGKQGPRLKTADPFRWALVAAVHRFAADGKLNHLRAVLDRHPDLIDARQTFRQPHKPVRTDGFTALHHAAERGREAVVTYLLGKGAGVNSDGGLGWTPLHLAAQQGHLGVVKLLVKAGAKVDARTVALPPQRPAGPPDAGPDGKSRLPQTPVALPSLTPLELAREAGHREVVKALAPARARPGKAKDNPVARDLKALEGTWEVVTDEVNGKKASEAGYASPRRIVIAAGKMDLFERGEADLPIKIDPAKTPKALDVYYPKAMKLNAHDQGIYALDKDTLKICLPLSGEAKRPTTFSSEGFRRLFILRRMK